MIRAADDGVEWRIGALIARAASNATIEGGIEGAGAVCARPGAMAPTLLEAMSSNTATNADFLERMPGDFGALFEILCLAEPERRRPKTK